MDCGFAVVYTRPEVGGVGAASSIMQSVVVLPSLGAVVALTFATLRFPARKSSPLHVVWFLFATSVACFALSSVFGQSLGPISDAMVVLGGAMCGWSWLLSRALFRPVEPLWSWPLGVVLVMMATAAWITLSAGSGPFGPGADAPLRMAANMHALTSSAVLLLALLEPMSTWNASLSRGERRFRWLFVAGYGSLLGVAVLWLGNATQGEASAAWSDSLRLVCALIALFGADLALRWRERHPLASQPPARRSRRSPTERDKALADRIIEAFERDALYTRPDIKVADLATTLAEADYRISHAITGGLGFANFNRLVNHYRIEHAKRMLSSSEFADRSILAIALDSGFGSIGPFNRAFKGLTGMTPSEFRGPPRDPPERSAKS
jgi:AraC-like DNA-binding protein